MTGARWKAETIPRIELVEVTADQRAVLDNLAQLYQYDFSEFTGGNIGRDGRFHWVDFDNLFSKPEHRAYVIHVDGKIAGFATAYRDSSFRDPAEVTWWMDEFFVMRAYRRRGVGERVAVEMFSKLGGLWEVGQIAANVNAQAFWRKVIDRFTAGQYEEIGMNDERWSGPVQCFNASGGG